MPLLDPAQERQTLAIFRFKDHSLVIKNKAVPHLVKKQN